MEKIRAPGIWLGRIQTILMNLDWLINATPTSEIRNKLTEINIELLKLEEFIQKEII